MPAGSGTYGDSVDLRGRWRRHGDVVVATLLLVICLVGLTGSDELHPRQWLAAITVAQVVPLIWRRHAPLLVGCASTAAYVVLNAVARGPYPPDLSVLPALVAVYTIGAHCKGRALLAGGVATFAGFEAAWILTPDGNAGDFLPWLEWGVAFGVGQLVQRRAAAVATLAAHNRLLEERRADDAAEAAARERDRIARELHDVVAHAVSVMVVQAGAERLSLGAGDTDVDRTSDVLAQIERSGREALDELRTMLGVLRQRGDDDAETGGLRPQPGLDDVAALVERMRERGVPASYEVEGDPQPVGSAVALSAYRIVQESLTNVVKHAGAVPTEVRLLYAPGELRVAVRNGDGKRGSGAGLAGGHGLIGMRERAMAVGGVLTAGPSVDGGWVVEATLPYSPATVRVTA